MLDNDVSHPIPLSICRPWKRQAPTGRDSLNNGVWILNSEIVKGEHPVERLDEKLELPRYVNDLIEPGNAG